MTSIVVQISEHEGTFYATSEQMPGFLLCSKDKRTLDADILPAMKALMAIKEKHQKPRAIQAKASHRLVEQRQLAIA